MPKVRLQHPYGDKQASAAVLAQHGALAVVDDPFADGFSVVIAAAGLAVSGYRYASADDAASVAAELDPLADFTLATDRDGRASLYTDLQLSAEVERIVMNAPGVLDVHIPAYPEGDRTGASYAAGYDERRRAAKRRS